MSILFIIISIVNVIAFIIVFSMCKAGADADKMSRQAFIREHLSENVTSGSPVIKE